MATRKKITSLTPAQEARFPEWVARYVALGLSTAPADWERAERGVHGLYDLAQLHHVRFVRATSPLAGAWASAIAAALLKQGGVGNSVWSSVGNSVWSSVGNSVENSVRNSVENSVRNSVWDSVRDSVWNSVWNSVRNSVWNSVRNSVWDSVRDSVWNSVENSVWNSVWDSVWNSVWDSVENSVWNSVGNSVRNSVENSVRNSVGNSVRNSVENSVENSVWNSVGNSVRNSVQWHPWYGGQFWISYTAWATYFRDVLGLDIPIGAFEDLSNSAGYCWPNDTFCMVSDRPDRIHLDPEGRLHDDTGMAIRWRDGWGLYAWHGVTVPAPVIERPDTITAAATLAEPNAEVRRVMMERMGHARFVQESGAQSVQADDYGHLYRIPRPDDSDLVMVRVENSTPEPDGSVKLYWLRVPPTIQTAREAVAWTFNIAKAEDYRPLVET